MENSQHLPATPVLHEPLQLSAPLARLRAPDLCSPDPASGLSCAWNHGLWQYLRLLGLITTPRHHAAFFRDAFAGISSPSGAAPGVLVSGAADYSMLAHVLAIFDERRMAPAVTVVDRCETPLLLNQWYARHIGRNITTCRTDILKFESASAFDLICSHSFLGQFDTPARTQLIARWRSLLRPGGLVATVNRVRPSATSAWTGFNGEQARAFSAMVLRTAQDRHDMIDVDPRQLADEAMIYAGKQGAYPVKSAEEIRRLFESSGFIVEHLACGFVDKNLAGGVSGPTTPGSAEYACIIARRV